MKKDFIVRRSITMIEGKPHVETYSETELVQCNNCKHYNHNKKWCQHIMSANGGEWFCADGEREDSNGEKQQSKTGEENI